MKKFLKAVWYFIWEDNSLLSWVVNVILAFLLVKFVIYPVLGALLGTSYPVVAVISSSMEHNDMGFDSWWDANKEWYLQNDIAKSELESSIFKNGFNKGDIIVLRGGAADKIKRYDVIVYSNDNYKYPIIHRVVNIEGDGIVYGFRAKGDNNPTTDPSSIRSDQVLGKAVIKVPYLGWIKLLFTELIGGI
ncbi:MAG: signal peptidase I [archaeon]